MIRCQLCRLRLGKRYGLKGVTIKKSKDSTPVYFCVECYFVNMKEINDRYINRV